MMDTWYEGENVCVYACECMYSFIHSGHFCSTSSSPLLLRSAPCTARILCRSFMSKRHRQLRVKDLLKVHMWWLEWTLCGPSSNLPMCHHATQPTCMFVSLYVSTCMNVYMNI